VHSVIETRGSINFEIISRIPDELTVMAFALSGIGALGNRIETARRPGADRPGA
jgi:hypothetical protein